MRESAETPVAINDNRRVAMQPRSSGGADHAGAFSASRRLLRRDDRVGPHSGARIHVRAERPASCNAFSTFLRAESSSKA